MVSTPDRTSLPRYVAPLPRRLEDFALRYVWVIVGVNVLGTAFGFWYYLPQFQLEPPVMWPFVPDSPLATLFIAASLGAWAVGRNTEWVNALAFFGCIKLGLWTPAILLALWDSYAYLHPVMFNFLFWSHLAMVTQAFLIHRYSEFPIRAVAVAATWYAADFVVDYVATPFGDPHHTRLPTESLAVHGTPDGGIVQHVFANPTQPYLDATVTHSSPTHEIAAALALAVTALALVLAVATRVKKQSRYSA